MYLVYFLLWIILNGRITLEICLFGFVIAAAMYAFSCRHLRHQHHHLNYRIKQLPLACKYGFTLVSEIVKANLNTMKMILNITEEPKPVLVHFETDLQQTGKRVLLANSITLTPGTITCDLDENAYTVHCLDESLIEGLADGVMPTMLKEMEEEA